jgi:hypothetical protein
LLATQKPDEALAILGNQSMLAKRQGQHRHLVDVLLLEARAVGQLGKQRSASNRIGEAITLAAPEMPSGPLFHYQRGQALA